MSLQRRRIKSLKRWGGGVVGNGVDRGPSNGWVWELGCGVGAQVRDGNVIEIEI